MEELKKKYRNLGLVFSINNNNPKKYEYGCSPINHLTEI